MTETSGYQLSRAWFNFAFENPEIIRPIHGIIYLFAIEHCNRLGWKDKFGFPTTMAMEAVGVKKYQTYIKAFNSLVDWGFIKLVQKSKNQYSANIINIKSAHTKKGKALDKAFIKHGSKQLESMGQSMGQSKDSIDKQVNNKQQTKGKHLDYVFLTQKEYEKLLVDFGEGKLKMCIEKLDNAIPNSKAAKSYKDHNRVLRGWVSRWFEDLPKSEKPRKSLLEMTDEERFNAC